MKIVVPTVGSVPDQRTAGHVILSVQGAHQGRVDQSGYGFVMGFEGAPFNLTFRKVCEII